MTLQKEPMLFEIIIAIVVLLVAMMGVGAILGWLSHASFGC